MKKELAVCSISCYNTSMQTNKTLLAKLIEYGTSKNGYFYTIRLHIEGSPNQYYSLSGEKNEGRNAIWYTGKSLSYVKRQLKEKG